MCKNMNANTACAETTVSCIVLAPFEESINHFLLFRDAGSTLPARPDACSGCFQARFKVRIHSRVFVQHFRSLCFFVGLLSLAVRVALRHCRMGDPSLVSFLLLRPGPPQHDLGAGPMLALKISQRRPCLLGVIQHGSSKRISDDPAAILAFKTFMHAHTHLTSM